MGALPLLYAFWGAAPAEIIEIEYASNSSIIAQIQNNLYRIEDEICKLKEATTILELALWKMRMNEESHNEKSTRRQKKMKADESIIRSQCRATCGADVVINLVLPFYGIWGISVGVR
jgi:hypothetical protein